jgi:type II secretory pathway component PulJ
MRSFVAAIIIAALLAVGFAIALNSIQRTSEAEFQTEGVRL